MMFKELMGGKKSALYNNVSEKKGKNHKKQTLFWKEAISYL